MGYNVKYIVSSFGWGLIAKILDAALKFVTIPLLLTYFGEDNFGLLTLVIAMNAYMQLLNMGMNTGAIKYFSQWIVAGKFELLNRVARTNLSFYTFLGLINTIVLLLLSFWGNKIFNITFEQFQVFQNLLLILSAASVLNWITFVFNQLLIADEKIAFIQQVLTAKAILNLVLVLGTIYMKLSLMQYFAWLTVLNVSIILPQYMLCKRRNLIKSIIPAFYWKDFYEVFKYSMGIFLMSIFQFTATQSRPIVLGMFSDDATSILAQYRIIEVFPIFIISVGGMIISILLPKTSKAIQNKDKSTINDIAYKGTTYTSILVSILCFPIIVNSEAILTLYIGDKYSNLAVWLAIWVFTMVLFLHNTPVASLVLATGKTKMLVYSSAISCIVSIIINSILCKRLGVGSAVVGYLVYIIIQMSFYYFFFINKILGLQSKIVFKSFIIPIFLGLLVTAGIYSLKVHNNLIIDVIVRTLLWGIFYFFLIFAFRIVKISTLGKLILK